ncbi:MAG: GGDEF domain-containing protein [Gammaproteobacteria bacterium]
MVDATLNELELATAEDIDNALDNAPLFFGVGVESVGVYLESCRVRSVSKDTVFISPTSNDRAVYIVLDGLISVRLEDHDGAPLTELVAGQCVGEMSIIEEDASPSAFVAAMTDCRLLVIDKQTVWNLINGSHEVARNLLGILAQRLRFNNDHIVDRNEIVEQNRHNAVTDALTDLHNRYWMQVMFARKIARAHESGETLCVAVLDLDKFKRYNDEFGHPKGDLLLQAIAGALRDLFRPTDLIARFGGDEFAVLLPNTALEAALEISARVRSGVLEKVATLESSGEHVTVSIGLAEIERSDDLDSLLNRADQALYRAKDSGRNCVSD